MKGSFVSFGSELYCQCYRMNVGTLLQDIMMSLGYCGSLRVLRIFIVTLTSVLALCPVLTYSYCRLQSVTRLSFLVYPLHLIFTFILIHTFILTSISTVLVKTHNARNARNAPQRPAIPAISAKTCNIRVPNKGDGIYICDVDGNINSEPTTL